MMPAKAMIDALVDEILKGFPDAQMIYLFGSTASGEARPDSDIDLAMLLPHAQARTAGNLTLSDLAFRLMRLAKRDVHLINLRLASTVLQNQVVGHGQVLHCADENARAEFEMLSLSFYQKLNEERAEIIHAFKETKRAYDV